MRKISSGRFGNQPLPRPGVGDEESIGTTHRACRPRCAQSANDGHRKSPAFDVKLAETVNIGESI